MSYENPTTYVDTESSKMLANAITGVGQVTAKYISDDVKRRAKEAKENEIKTEKHTQAYKKYQLAGQDNANLITKDLNFASNKSFRDATSGVIDRLAKAKADYEFATEPEEVKRLSKEIYELDTFFKTTFGGEIDDLMADVEEMKIIQEKQGAEGGLDPEQDANYTALLMAMAQGNEPGEMSFTMDPDTQDIRLTVKGDKYEGGSYTLSLKGNQSTEVARIPDVEKGMRTGIKGKPSALQDIGVFDEGGSIPPKYFSSEEGDSQDLANNKTVFRYKINEQGEKLVKDAVIAEAAGLLNGGEGLAGGIKGANSYYRNILLRGKDYKAAKNGDSEDLPAFLEAGSHDVTDEQGNILYTVPVDEKSWNAIVDRMTEREVSFVNSRMALKDRATVATSTDGKGTEKERTRLKSINDFTNEVSVDIATGTSVSDIYNGVKNNTSTYDYDPGTGFTSDVRSEKDFKDNVISLTPQQLNDQGFIDTFTEQELKNPKTNGKLKSTIQDKINDYLADLGDSEDKFVNYNDGTSMTDKQALVALFKSTPKYADLKPSELQKLVNDAWSKRPKDKTKPKEEEDVFGGDSIEAAKKEYSKEYAIATSEDLPKSGKYNDWKGGIIPGKGKAVGVGKNSKLLRNNLGLRTTTQAKEEFVRLKNEQKKNRKLLEEKYPNAEWPWSN